MSDQTFSDILGNMFDIREVIERFEELETTRENADDETREETEEEFNSLKTFLEDIAGNGGDHEWRGHWYPVTFIRESHFEDYAREFAVDIGAVKDDTEWPATCIDWEKAATELQQDFSSVDIEGETYWYR